VSAGAPSPKAAAPATSTATIFGRCGRHISATCRSLFSTNSRIASAAREDLLRWVDSANRSRRSFTSSARRMVIVVDMAETCRDCLYTSCLAIPSVAAAATEEMLPRSSRYPDLAEGLDDEVLGGTVLPARRAEHGERSMMAITAGKSLRIGVLVFGLLRAIGSSGDD